MSNITTAQLLYLMLTGLVNRVWQNTADANGIPLRPVPDGSTIGPSSWS